MSLEYLGIPNLSPRRRWPVWKWLLLVVGTIVAAVVFFISNIHITRRGPEDNYFRTTINMRQIGMGLYEFENLFGSYPDDSTIALVRERYPETKIPMGTSSANDYFHQLFAPQLIPDPLIFHAYGVSTRRPIEVVDGEPPLPPGTCGFAYIITDGQSVPPDTPLVVYPLVRGKFVFDKKLCKLGGGKAYILRADNSVTAHPIDSSGRMIIDGRDLFDPEHPHWHGRSFRVAWPE